MIHNISLTADFYHVEERKFKAIAFYHKMSQYDLKHV
jgi:hypothetical protein